MKSKKKFLKNFICTIVHNNFYTKKINCVKTRFAPEPSGYLHIGHAKSIYLNFSIANYYNGICNLRFDDTNPITGNIRYINSIIQDIQWLGFYLNDCITFSSDYFKKIYFYAIELIKKNLAYVDELSIQDISRYRGTLKYKGINSPYRNRSIEENLFLFSKMKEGKIKEGKACLRAKIDMKSSNIIMRDPILYRIKFAKHYRIKNKWCIYPMYDFAHCISDAIENITHSLCTLEFLNNRLLYNWILNNISIKNKPKQYEFSRLNIEYFLTSKRKLYSLIKKKLINEWNDPRLLTISGLKRKGYTASSILDFCKSVGFSKKNQFLKVKILESYIRKELNKISCRIMAIINPVLLVIKNFPKFPYKEKITILNHPKNKYMGNRDIFITKLIYIEKNDFLEKKTKGFTKLVLGGKIKLRYSYVIKAYKIKKNIFGKIIKIYCKYIVNKNKKKYRIIHWVSVSESILSEFRLYKKPFLKKNIDYKSNYLNFFNKNSLIKKIGFVDIYVINTKNVYQSYQFERIGYFCADSYEFTKKLPVFNRIVSLKNNNKFNKKKL